MKCYTFPRPFPIGKMRADMLPLKTYRAVNISFSGS